MTLLAPLQRQPWQALTGSESPQPVTRLGRRPDLGLREEAGALEAVHPAHEGVGLQEQVGDAHVAGRVEDLADQAHQVAGLLAGSPLPAAQHRLPSRSSRSLGAQPRQARQDKRVCTLQMAWLIRQPAKDLAAKLIKQALYEHGQQEVLVASPAQQGLPHERWR